MKKTDFLIEILGNQNRARLLRLFCFEPKRSFTFKEITKLSGVSQQAAVHELQALEKLGIIKKAKTMSITLGNGTKRVVESKQKEDVWAASPNTKDSIALSRFVHEVAPIEYDHIIETLRRTGKLSTIVLSGTFLGDPSRPIDILIAGDAMNEDRLEDSIKKLESSLGREIRYACFSTSEFRYRLTVQDRLLRDTLDYPHLALFDRARLL